MAKLRLADTREPSQSHHRVREPAPTAFLSSACPRIQTLLPNGAKGQNPEKVCKSVAMGREGRGRSAEMFSFDRLKSSKLEKLKFSSRKC